MRVRRSDTPRPRVEGERETEILTAALDTLVEVGYDRLTMDAVAVRARASKATLYRRWESKQALVVDALRSSKNTTLAEDVDTGSLRGDLIASFCGEQSFTEERESQILLAVLSALHTDPVFTAEFREKFLLPKVRNSQAIYQRARDRGELAEGADPSLLGPALGGILLHRHMVIGEPLTNELVERVIDQIILPAATRGPHAKDAPS